MADNITATASTDGKEDPKLVHAIGVLNISLGITLFVDTLLLAIAAVCCLLLSLSLFFIVALPAFLLIGALCLLCFAAAIANIATGIGTCLMSTKAKANVSTILSIVTIFLDGIIIPANIVAIVSGAYLLYTEVNVLSILILIVATAAPLLAVASMILTIIRIKHRHG